MKDLTVSEWAAFGFIVFVAIAGISYALLRASERRRERPVSEWTDEHWRAR